ncbi:MFS transporter [Flavobacterium sp. NG2]|uniref:MFS transporter n=1 Tax=Flavobacterium sp. NG2 TaxID=3097547 RepID=UPI002A83EC8B|nr:MFS transporter [Flavobacterium sp. NG2]WPR70434.1 MFS transporter [Flavobacterium sp. NG2]
MKKVLFLIVIAQFLCTSLWFAGNAVLPELIVHLGLGKEFLAHSTSAIQLGFIIGTLFYALFSIADRYSPSWVFFVSAILAAIFNMWINVPQINVWGLLLFRFFTGFFLAGIYPIGIKIAADYYNSSLGKSLGYLVGALVLGTAFPHLIKGMAFNLPWQYVAYATSTFSVIGGFLIVLFIPDGPYRTKGTQFQLTTIYTAFRNKSLTAAAVGYFGHMWELYAFWTFLPLMLQFHQNLHPELNYSISLYSFGIIAIGSIACILSGYLSTFIGTEKLSKTILFLSGCCCLVSPFFIMIDSEFLFISFLLFWSFVVIADSPLFSTLVAQNAPSNIKGSVITIVNCIGFFITIISIQILQIVLEHMGNQYSYSILAIGPIVGLYYLRKLRKQ